MIWIVSANEKGFLQHSLVERFSQLNLEVHSFKADVKQLSAECSVPDSIVITADEEILGKPDALIYIRDLAVREGIPIFIMGDKDPMDMILRSFDSIYIKACFHRPVDVKEVAKTVDAYLAFAGRQV